MDNYKLEFTIHGWTKGFVTGFIKQFKRRWDNSDGDILVSFGHRFTSNTVHAFEEVGNNPIVLRVYRSIISGNYLTEPDKILIATLTVRDDNIATFQCSDPLSLPEPELTDWLNDKFTISNPPAIDAGPVVAEETKAAGGLGVIEKEPRGPKAGTLERVQEMHRLLKGGASQSQAVRQAKIDPRTYQRWCKQATGEAPVLPYR